MRVWLDPDKVASRNLTAPDIVNALQEQNVQVAAGAIGRPPVPQGQAFQYPLTDAGPADGRRSSSGTSSSHRRRRPGHAAARRRLRTPRRWWTTPVPNGNSAASNSARKRGHRLHARRQAVRRRLHLSASRLQRDRDRRARRERMKELKSQFPGGVDYDIVYDTTPFVEESIARFSTPFATRSFSWRSSCSSSCRPGGRR